MACTNQIILTYVSAQYTHIRIVPSQPPVCFFWPFFCRFLLTSADWACAWGCVFSSCSWDSLPDLNCFENYSERWNLVRYFGIIGLIIINGIYLLLHHWKQGAQAWFHKMISSSSWLNCLLNSANILYFWNSQTVFWSTNTLFWLLESAFREEIEYGLEMRSIYVTSFFAWATNMAL